ncbi:hypothetical protein PRIPAC_81311, partial [Pristionchus pacificus]|uniref:G protein-coupled receptor n=1 Tax=Pristionchus pacificus TaxID=54126 RepID=A0A2A6C4J7_PRIPA
MNSFYLSPQLHHSINFVVILLFCISTFASVFVLYCLLKLSSSHQIGLCRYLIYQTLAIIYDLHFDVLFIGHPLIPLLGGFFDGFLCALGVPIMISVKPLWKCVHLKGITVANMGVGILMCLLYRHQSIILDSSRFKFNRRVVPCAHVILITLFSLPGALFIIFPIDTSRTDKIIEESPLDIACIRNKGFSFVMYDRFELLTPLVFIVSF